MIRFRHWELAISNIFIQYVLETYGILRKKGETWGLYSNVKTQA